MLYNSGMQSLLASQNRMDNNTAWLTTKSLINSYKQNVDNGNEYCFGADTIFGKVPGAYTPTQWLVGTTHNYANLLISSNSLESIKLRSRLRLTNLLALNLDFFAYGFPHMSTIDQSLYIDQSLALIGLGYLQTKTMLNEINN